jgi:hypothetical protein
VNSTLRPVTLLLAFLVTGALCIPAGASKKNGGPRVSTPEGLIKQLSKEIEELDVNRAREDALFRQQKDLIAKEKMAVEKAQAAYDQAAQASGAESQEALQANDALEKAKVRLMLAISQKDHTLYRLAIVERGIHERRVMMRQKQAQLTASSRTAQ